MSHTKHEFISEHSKLKLAEGGLIAYPAEAVYGLGCLPGHEQAVKKLLAVKNRPVYKGLILVAANYSQLLPYIDDKKIPQEKRYEVFSHWPGPTTLLLPAKAETPSYLTGDHKTLAVRVTDFKPLAALCLQLETALVSTSANRQGGVPLTDCQSVQAEFGDQIDIYIQGDIGGYSKTSRILDPMTGEVFRA